MVSALNKASIVFLTLFLALLQGSFALTASAAQEGTAPAVEARAGRVHESGSPGPRNCPCGWQLRHGPSGDRGRGINEKISREVKDGGRFFRP